MPEQALHRRMSLIGFGAIGHTVARAVLTGRAGAVALSAVLVREASRYGDDPLAAQLVADAAITFTDDPASFLATPADLVVEAAGQEAVRAYGRTILDGGSDLLVVSIGAFTDDQLYAEMRAAAEGSVGRLMLASGALPAVDWMQAASLDRVTSVRITQTKPVASWRGTPAEELTDLAELTGPVCFFEGAARAAARVFAKSSNITAMLALATVGMDQTHVRLVADPASSRMHTRIEFASDAGELRVEWRGTPSSANPSTSADVPLSVIKAVRNWVGDVVVGV